MDDFDKLIERFDQVVYPSLTSKSQSIIRDDKFIHEMEWVLDGYLQFALIDHVDVPDELLDEAEAVVRAGWEEEIFDRTLGWIAKHRELHHT